MEKSLKNLISARTEGEMRAYQAEVKLCQELLDYQQKPMLTLTNQK